MRGFQTLALVTVLLIAAGAAGVGLGAVAADASDAPAATNGPTVFETNNTTTNETEVGENATADNETDAFGQLVSAFVHDLQANNSTSGPFGFRVATFVLANNPAADVIPDHAGPPANRTAGPPANVTQGPPDHAGPDNSTEGEPGPPEDRGNDGGGPPEDAGNGNAGPPKLAGPR